MFALDVKEKENTKLLEAIGENAKVVCRKQTLWNDGNYYA